MTNFKILSKLVSNKMPNNNNTSSNFSKPAPKHLRFSIRILNSEGVRANLENLHLSKGVPKGGGQEPVSSRLNIVNEDPRICSITLRGS